ncbi:MAG: glycosyltransferase [Comamonadaceae bacterium]|nr:glycosyltransferase [Comamonadaceae bacterium]
MTAVAALLWLLVALVAVPVLVVWLQVLLAWPRRGDGLPVGVPGGVAAEDAALRCAVLVPAHDEAAVIGETVRALRTQLGAGDTLLVVADNCGDETARIARAAGATVVERADAERRGKGYALDFGVRHLAGGRVYDALLIVDADCSVQTPQGIHHLARMAVRCGRPVQALYLMDAPEGGSIKTRVAAFAWRLKNWVRPLGWHVLGWPCQLMGTGMAFPWAMASHMQLANAELVEDMKLGVDLALAGTPPLFCPEVLVRSTFPTAERAVQSQRTRWEHGHLGMIAAHAPRLGRRALRLRSGALLAMALDIGVPPLALLVLLQLGVLVVCAFAATWGAGGAPLWGASLCVVLFASAAGLAWWGWGSAVVSLRDLAQVPGYVLAKLPIYLGYLLHRRQQEWIRTDRDPPDATGGIAMNVASDIESGAMKVALVADHASLKFGGEAALPFHYFRVLMQRGVDVRLFVHERTRTELEAAFPDAVARMVFVEDTWLNKFLWRVEERLPWRVGYFTAGWLLRISTQIRMRRRLLQSVRDGLVNIVHQVIPVSPKEPSFMFGLGVPVIIGPMNGGMRYPDGFLPPHRGLKAWGARSASAVATLLNRVIPGKPRASVILVANRRTEQALPGRRFNKVTLFVENGVDLDVWRRDVSAPARDLNGICCFVFIGRLVEWKAVDLLIEAYARMAAKESCSLLIIGGGPAEAGWMAQAEQLGLLERDFQTNCAGKICFAGWKDQTECADILSRSDVLVLPSLMECGGAVVLEAMAMGLPVIATRWGGPVDYLDDTCGRLVDPTGREAFVDGLAAAMQELARSPTLRASLGDHGRARVVRFYDWERKVDQMMDIYHETLNDWRRAG